MANTVSLLNFTNTFGDWVVATNNLAKENNDFAANNYIKPTGTLYLNAPTLGIQVANNAVIAGQLQVQGIGSSAYIQNNLRVDTQVYFQNTILGLTNSGELISNGKISASGSGTGLAVANNTTIGGTLNVTGATALGNTLTVLRSTTLSNTLSVAQNATFASNVIAQNYVNVTNDVNAVNFNALGSLNSYGVNVIGNGSFSGQVSVGGNFVINGTTVYSTNTFTLNAGSAVGLTSYFNVNRGSSGANSSIRWNESNTYFDILNVNNSVYYRILTNEHLSNSLLSTSSSNVATSLAANTLNNNINSANTFLQANTGAALAASKVYTDTANTSLKSYVDNTASSLQSQISSNTTLSFGINSTQNTNITSVNTYAASGYAFANTTAGFLSANVSLQSGINASQNTNISDVNTYAASGYAFANTTFGLLSANVALQVGINSTQNTSISDVNTYATSAYATANAVNTYAGSAYGTANNRVSSITGTANQITVTGTLTPTLSLPQSIHTGASVQFGSFGVGTGASGTAGEIRATNNITAYYSDNRLKTRLGPIENALDKVMTLNGFYYEANETAQALGYTVKREVGLSAQEVQAVLPEIVVPAPIDEKYLTIYYEKVVPLLVEAIKELKLEIDILKNK